MLKYALHPDFVTSRTDGDVHYIGAARLADLYDLQEDEYIIIDDSLDHHGYAQAMRHAEGMNLIHLYPRYDGNYQLPT